MMSGHVVVIDSAARRYNIKTTPNKHLSDVLEEACKRVGINVSQYGLKHNNKTVDLSRTIRLAGLSSGAKLELVQLSRSAGVVSVALQLPESEGQGGLNARLTDKFPSTTTLWLILRKFEAGVAGGSTGSRNLTAKGAPSTSAGNSGAGRLYYQQPVIQVMGRELASFTDLQKSLAQLGLNTGTALLRLNYRPSEKPLEEALTQIQQYFDSMDAIAAAATPVQPSVPTPTEQLVSTTTSTALSSANIQPTMLLESISESTSQPEPLQPSQAPDSMDDVLPQATVGNRPVSVYKPPTAAIPLAALMSHNEADYTPTVEHAQLHQKMLQQNSMNKRLLTDAELEQQALEAANRIAATKDVEVKVRFPDQSTVSTTFTQLDSAADLYNFARGCLVETFRDQPFVLRNPGMRGKGEVIADDEKKLLIKHLLLKGRVLVVFGWADRASVEARGARNVLKEGLQSVAQDIPIPQIPGAPDDQSDAGVKVNLGKRDESTPVEGSGSKKIPKWLKGLAKK